MLWPETVMSRGGDLFDWKELPITLFLGNKPGWYGNPLGVLSGLGLVKYFFWYDFFMDVCAIFSSEYFG